MEIPEYITLEEIKRVCKELNIRDWTTLEQPEVESEEALEIAEKRARRQLNQERGRQNRAEDRDFRHAVLHAAAGPCANHGERSCQRRDYSRIP